MSLRGSPQPPPGDADANLAAELARLEAHYTALIRRHGAAPAGAQWRDRDSQERRMVVLGEVGDMTRAKILDFGCGAGHLLTVLRSRFGFQGAYVGYDLVDAALASARAQHPGDRFERHDVLVEPIDEEFDYILISGVFNNLVKDNWTFLTTILRKLYPRARRALAFNALSTYVDRFDPELYYFDPARVFAFCKEELSAKVTLRHDYELRDGVVPFEFTVYVHRTNIALRANRSERGGDSDSLCPTCAGRGG